MKKLIVAVAAVAMAIAANASSVTWSLSGVYASPAQGTISSYSAYLIDGSVYSYADVTAETVLSVISGSAVLATKNPTDAGLVSGGSVDVTEKGYAAGSAADFYAIVIDDSQKNYMLTTEKTGTFTAQSKYSALFGSQSSNTWNEIGTVPEPTSGLLLLLGMAGLALKRKQA